MAQFLFSLDFFEQGKSNIFITFSCPSFVLVKKVIFWKQDTDYQWKVEHFTLRLAT